MNFIEFPKIARLNRVCTITEKIDGTNGQIYIGEDGLFLVGSRSHWITPADDNHGFARWAHANREELMRLGPGSHFGEWWGSGIQRGYGLPNGDKRFSLFNTARWCAEQTRPPCCDVVPVLYEGKFCTAEINDLVTHLHYYGSKAVPGYMKPEGVIVYHHAANLYFKATLHKDEEWKGKSA